MKHKYIVGLSLAAFLNSCVMDHFPQQPGEENLSSFQEVADIDLGGTAASEISAYDPASKRLFVVNNESKALVEVLDLSQLPTVTRLTPIDISALGGVANSVSVHDGMLAIALEGTDKQANGKVIVVNTASLATIRQVAVGALPDMVTFSPDGRYIITADEGEPNVAYTNDPKGSISVIDVSNDFSVKTLTFDAFAGSFDALAQKNFRVFGINASFAQDIEPEYIAVSTDSKKAFVTLQENNGIAELDLASATISRIHPLGTKDLSKLVNAIDPSDRDNKIALTTVPVKSLYLPDAISYFSVNGSNYLITANEGDAREYAALDEQTRVSAVNLDPAAFPNAASLKQPANLGRLRITNTLGDTDKDGDYDVLFGFGGRGFSIFNAADMSLVHDSGADFEQKVLDAGVYDDDRSDDKGIEPEGVTVSTINGKPIAFIALERADAIAVYDLSNPAAPHFLQLIKTGNAPEGVLLIPSDKSPNGKSLLVTANEGDGTVKFYQTK